MDINKEISDFLRDAQYKLALMTAEMDSLEDDGDVYYQELKEGRWELDYFYSILYETTMAMAGGIYNWLETAEWTDKDILNEIHYLRNKHKLNGLPVLEYASSVTKIVNYVNESGGGAAVPEPVGVGDILVGSAGGWIVGSLNEYAGMLDTEALNTYFATRP